MLLDLGLNLTLRPMRYPQFYEMYRNGIRNTWTVEEVDFSIDVAHLRDKISPAERHMIQRLVAFFATGDSIVANNVVLSIYSHINSPEARLYLSRQLYEEALHVQFYLTLLDTYVPDIKERARAFDAIKNIASIKAKADFCFRWMESINDWRFVSLNENDRRRGFLLNLICFATCVEGLFFFAAFAYVYFMRSKGLLPGLASGTNWVFRDESCHMAFAYEAIRIIRNEQPELFDNDTKIKTAEMIQHAVDIESMFADDLLQYGITGLSSVGMRKYLEYTADQRLAGLGLRPLYGSKNPFPFMELQDVQELTNFFERRVASYQVGVTGEVSLTESF